MTDSNAITKGDKPSGIPQHRMDTSRARSPAFLAAVADAGIRTVAGVTEGSKTLSDYGAARNVLELAVAQLERLQLIRLVSKKLLELFCGHVAALLTEEVHGLAGFHRLDESRLLGIIVLDLVVELLQRLHGGVYFRHASCHLSCVPAYGHIPHANLVPKKTSFQPNIMSHSYPHLAV